MKNTEHFDDMPLPGASLFAEPRGYHFEALNKILEARQAGHKRALITVAVGMGRCLLGAADLVNYYNTAITQDPAVQPHLLHVSSGNLMNREAQRKITSLLPELTISTELEQPPEATLTFSTFQTLYRRLDTINPDSYNYITWSNFNNYDNRADLEVAKHFNPTFSLAIQNMPSLHGEPLEGYFGGSVYQSPNPLA